MSSALRVAQPVDAHDLNLSTHDSGLIIHSHASEASIPDLPEAIWERLLLADPSASTNSAAACTCQLLRSLIARVQLPDARSLTAVRQHIQNGSGAWRDRLYSAAIIRASQEAAARPHSAHAVQAPSSGNTEQIEFSAFFPQRADLGTAVVLVTDGIRLVLLDSSLRLHRGLIPPHSASMNRPRLWQASQLLAVVTFLPHVTYLDITNHSTLTDSSIATLLMACARSLTALSAAGTQLGVTSLALLGLQGQLQLCSLDLSDSLAAPLPTDQQDDTSNLGLQLNSLQLGSSSRYPIQHSSSSGVAAGCCDLRSTPQPRHSESVAATSEGMFEVGGQGLRLAAACTQSSEAVSQQLYAAALRAALTRLPALTVLHLQDMDITGVFAGSLTCTTGQRCRSESGPGLISRSTPISATIHDTAECQNERVSSVSGCVDGVELFGHPCLAALMKLNISGSAGFTQQSLIHALQCCPRLRKLDVSRCKGLAQTGSRHSPSESTQQPGSSNQHSGRCSSQNGYISSSSSSRSLHSSDSGASPSLHSLSVGWGCSRAVMSHLTASSPFLTSLSVGVGASMNDEGLKAVAYSCPHLTQCKITFGNVSDPGVNILLRRCLKLQVIHLNWCSGPLTAALLSDINIALPDLPAQLCYPSSGHKTASAPAHKYDMHGDVVRIWSPGASTDGTRVLSAAAETSASPASGSGRSETTARAAGQCTLSNDQPAQAHDCLCAHQSSELQALTAAPAAAEASPLIAAAAGAAAAVAVAPLAAAMAAVPTAVPHNLTHYPVASPSAVLIPRPAPLRRWALQELQICSSNCTLNDRDISTLIDGGVRYKPVATLHTLALVSCSGLSSMLLTHLAKHAPTLKHLRIEDCGSYGRPAVSPPTGTPSTDNRAASCSSYNTSGSSRGSSICGERSSAACEGNHQSSGCKPGHQPAVGVQCLRGDTGQERGSAFAVPDSLSVEGPRTTSPAPRQHVPTATYTREPFSETSLLKLLASCGSLKSLRLRHVCQLSKTFVESLIKRCPLLDSLLLDCCDLQGHGFSTEGVEPYAALTVVHVARCMSPDGPGQSQVEGHTRAGQNHGLGDGSGRSVPQATFAALDNRRVDRDVHVHMLLEGRTVQREMHS